jgi:hypothetical protein
MTAGVSNDGNSVSLPEPTKRGREPDSVDLRVQEVRKRVSFSPCTKTGDETKPVTKKVKTDYLKVEDLLDEDFYDIEESLIKLSPLEVNRHLEEKQFSLKQLQQLMERCNRLRLPQFNSVYGRLYELLKIGQEPKIDDAVFSAQCRHSFFSDVVPRALQKEFENPEAFKKKIKDEFSAILGLSVDSKIFDQILEDKDPSTFEFWADFFTDADVAHLPKFLEVREKLELDQATVSRIKNLILESPSLFKNLAYAVLKPLIQRRLNLHKDETIAQSLIECVKNCPWAKALFESSTSQIVLGEDLMKKTLEMLSSISKTKALVPQIPEAMKNLYLAVGKECSSFLAPPA